MQLSENPFKSFFVTYSRFSFTIFRSRCPVVNLFKKRLPQVISYKFCEIFKNNLFHGTFLVISSAYWNLVGNFATVKTEKKGPSKDPRGKPHVMPNMTLYNELISVCPIIKITMQ